MGKQTPGSITDAELAVLESLWEQQSATIRALCDTLYPGGSAAHYATVQKLLERLEGKQCVGRRREGARHVYFPLVSRAALIESDLRKVAEKLCGGSLTPLLNQLVAAVKLSPRERQRLARLLESGSKGIEKEASS